MAALPAGSRVLLTGATGFLGRHILAGLRGSGAEVVAARRRPPDEPDAEVAWRRADLLDAAACRALIAEIRPTHLIHSAWMAVPGQFWASPDNAEWLKAGIALVDAFGAAGGRRFVGLGTCAEYDWAAGRFSEDSTPALASTPYGKAKAALEAAADALAARHGLSAAWGRIFLPYGPGDAPERLIPSVLAAIARREAVNLSDGTQVRDFIFAPDAADLILRLAAGAEEGIFNVGTGIGVSVREAVERVAALAGGADLLRFGALPNRGGEPDRLVADMTKATRILGWKPRHDLAAGLAETVAAFRARGQKT